MVAELARVWTKYGPKSGDFGYEPIPDSGEPSHRMLVRRSTGRNGLHKCDAAAGCFAARGAQQIVDPRGENDYYMWVGGEHHGHRDNEDASKWYAH
jgi:hypothetical protein